MSWAEKSEAEILADIQQMTDLTIAAGSSPTSMVVRHPVYRVMWLYTMSLEMAPGRWPWNYVQRVLIRWAFRRYFKMIDAAQTAEEDDDEQADD